MDKSVNGKFVENQLWTITQAALEALKEMNSKYVGTRVEVGDDKELVIKFGVVNKGEEL
ncbi:RNA-binding protein [Nosocomiicoccus ampullae]|uniref:RNA-binding protein n=1 Tax=Nosocomiicoccus ampullae TaxID=489910 RepID=UPI001C5EB848|nr:RNA-binding protein [Nosocomiicoccus ampullae]QYA47983.1 RNA-binding protein [Nosocomiicoccus ampullae]